MSEEIRHVTPEPETRDRFSLYRLCHCPSCEGKGQVPHDMAGFPTKTRCPDCRGEGRIRDEIATCETPEAVGLALVTLAREGEWIDTDGNPCAFGLLDREGEKGKKWLVSPWLASARNVHDAAVTLAKSRKKLTPSE